MATADVSYVPGALTAVAGDQYWALIEVSPDSPAVTRIWQQLGQGAAADALLAGLLADGIGGTPGFTLLVAVPGGPYRLFCRGTVGATVVTGPADGAPAGRTRADERQAATERIDGAGLLTWREQVIDHADRIFLGEPPADTALRLPATSGVLLAGCVIVELTNLAVRETVSYGESSFSPDMPKKSIVFFPDTITVTHPGSLLDQASAASAAGHLPDDRGPVVSPAPSMPFAAGPAGPSGGPGWPDVSGSGAFLAPTMPPSAGSAGLFGGSDAPGSGAFPAPAMPPAAVPAGRFGGPAPAGVPSGPDTVPGPGLPDGRVSDDTFVDGTVVDDAIRPAGRSDPFGPFPAGGAHGPGGYAGAGPQAPAQYQGAPPPAATPWPPLPDGGWAGGPRPGPPMTGQMPPTAPLPARAPAPSGGMPPNGMSPGPAGGLIDAPPWLSGPGGPAPAGGAPAESGYSDSGYGDSGSTVKRRELSELVARTTPPDRIGPVVPALICPSGHVNPPSGAVCRRCGAPLPHDPVPVPRPVLGVLRLSLGDVIMLDRGVLMGRNPRTDFGGPDGLGGSGGEERPHVVKLPSADGDISRTHLRVSLDGWHVLVTDLNSTNGTLVTLPGRDPQQLRPGEPVPIQPGTVVTLAEGIDFRYEVSN